MGFLMLRKTARAIPFQEIIMSTVRPLFFALPVLSMAQSCDAACDNKIISEAKSPNGSYTAALFERNCGATTGSNFQVSVFRTGDYIDGSGNTFIIDYPNGYYLQRRPKPTASVSWLSNSKVKIQYTSGARIFTQAIMIQGVEVQYVAR
jgi:hypothetical protein